ncbi:MAG: cytochrome c biogenesis protein CcsA [Candidatus Neomarinimicrobiota bacterium]
MMEKFIDKKSNLIWAVLIFVLMGINLANILWNTPMVRDQHWAQKIFYYHVPAAWVGFLSSFIVLVSGIQFLMKKDIFWDHMGLAAAEIGTLFMSMVLLTGPIWAKPIWGTAWIWEPRLTTTLVLYLIYIGYFMLRSFGGSPQRVRRYAAALGIIAFVDVPIIFLSVKFWTPEIQSHPQVEMSSQPGGILFPFFFSMVTFTLLYVLMLKYRIYILNLKELRGTNV